MIAELDRESLKKFKQLSQEQFFGQRGHFLDFSVVWTPIVRAYTTNGTCMDRCNRSNREVNFGGVPHSPMSGEPQQDGPAGRMGGLYAVTPEEASGRRNYY
jgi:hypothetical protein